jgi:DNA-binding response OmpR family regulator
MYILVVDDDPLSRNLAEFIFRNEGYEVTSVDNTRGAYHLIEQRLPDLLLLDVSLPGQDGFTFSEQLTREGYTIATMFVTACTSLDERLRGYDLQAEDYICKPFHPQELLKRVQIIARHQGKVHHPPAQHLWAGSMELLPEALQVCIHDQNEECILLTPREMHILLLLMSHCGQAVRRELFAERVWHEEQQTSNTLDVFIRRLRKKLSGHQIAITCVRNVGYCLQT